MQQLFRPVSSEVKAGLNSFPKILAKILPLNGNRRRDLPIAVAELSARLTSERAALSRPYWTSPRLVSAYMHYFLPWNLLRQTRLLASLPLIAPDIGKEDNHTSSEAILFDIGSGPLTFPIALWLAKPQWRNIPITVVCSDNSPHILKLGREILSALAGPESPWRIVLYRGGFEWVARYVRKNGGYPWMISAANILNEFCAFNSQARFEILERIIKQIVPVMDDDKSQVLFVEPGTRLGGGIICEFREAASLYGLSAVAPCPHTNRCPLRDNRSWCHFTFDTSGVPFWLEQLSEKAGLTKDALSLSLCLLRKQKAPLDDGHDRCRVISAPMHIPGLKGLSRYACTPYGLALLENASSLPSGSLLSFSIPEKKVIDKKSGAFIIPSACQEDGQDRVSKKVLQRDKRL